MLYPIMTECFSILSLAFCLPRNPSSLFIVNSLSNNVQVITGFVKSPTKIFAKENYSVSSFDAEFVLGSNIHTARFSRVEAVSSVLKS